MTQKELAKRLNISRVALAKRLAQTPYTLKYIDGSSKKVKHYLLTDLPTKIQTQLSSISLPTTEVEKDKMIEVTSFMQASENKRARAMLILALLDEYEHKSSDLSCNAWIQTLSSDYNTLEVTPTKLYAWLRKTKEARAKGVAPVTALIDSRGRNAGSTLAEESKAFVIRKMTDKKASPNLKETYLDLCFQLGGSSPSYDTVRRFWNDWKIKNASMYDYFINPKSWKNTRLAAFGNASEEARGRLDIVEIDATVADIITTDGKRHMILGIIDLFSRRAVLHLEERNNSYANARALRKFIIKLGMPKVLVTDNGAEYTSNHFRSIVAAMGITQKQVPPFSGDAKPHIERLFGTMTRELFRSLPGFAGHSVAEREAIVSRRSFEEQLKKQDLFKSLMRESENAFVSRFQLKKENLGLEVNVSLTTEELRDWLDRWCNTIYENRKHSSLGATPLEQWHKDFMPVESVRNPRALDLLLGESFVKTVQKKGIRLNGCTYSSKELALHIQEKVKVLCDDQADRIYVYSNTLEFICIAYDYTQAGKSREALADGKRLSRKLMRSFEEIRRNMDRLLDNDVDIRDRIAASEMELREIDAKPTMKIERTSDIIEAITKQSDKETIKPQTNHLNGRPLFRSLSDRFAWCLTHDDITARDRELMEQNEEIVKDVKQMLSKKVG